MRTRAVQQLLISRRGCKFEAAHQPQRVDRSLSGGARIFMRS